MNTSGNAKVFLLAYFRTAAESLHLAWSRDGLDWTAFNENQPILTYSEPGRTVRDPFIRRGTDGYYHLIATSGWAGCDILHARSKDLMFWEAWKVLPVMGGVPGAECVWAPEFLYDPARRLYVIYWSSAVRGSADKTIWYSETADFRNFTRPATLFDPGYSVIDATLVESNGTWYLIYKDERGQNQRGTEYKAMRVATGSSPRGPFAPRTDLVTPPLTEGPTVFRAGSRWIMLYDHFLEDFWGASESQDLLNWQPLSGVRVPEGARHGSVFIVSQAEWQRLDRRLTPMPDQWRAGQRTF